MSLKHRVRCGPRSGTNALRSAYISQGLSEDVLRCVWAGIWAQYAYQYTDKGVYRRFFLVYQYLMGFYAQ